MKPLARKTDPNRQGPLTIITQTIRCATTREFKVTITVLQLQVEIPVAHIDRIMEVLRIMDMFSIPMVEHNNQAFQGLLQIIVHHKTPKVNQA